MAACLKGEWGLKWCLKAEGSNTNEKGTLSFPNLKGLQCVGIPIIQMGYFGEQLGATTCLLGQDDRQDPNCRQQV